MVTRFEPPRRERSTSKNSRYQSSARRLRDHAPRGQLYLAAVKTNAGNRILPLVDPLKTMLALHSQRAGVSQHGLVFCHADGSPIDPDSVTVGWQRWLTRSGITGKHVRLHDLRHTTVDLLYEAHVPGGHYHRHCGALHPACSHGRTRCVAQTRASPRRWKP